MKDFNNYSKETFKELPELVIGCNFNECTFKASTKFERCNLTKCTFDKASTFYLSNVTDGIFNKECVFDKSNNINSEEEKKLFAREEEVKE